MTAEDYRKALVQARDNWPKLTAPTKRKIRAAYVKAGRDIAEVLRNGTLVDGQLDAATQRAFDQAVLVASSEIAEAMRTKIPEMILTGALALSAIEAELLTSAFGGVFGRGITPDGIARAFDKVARDTVTKSLSTILDDGYSFWGRVPNVSRYFGDDVVNLVRAAIDHGRDLGKIAADVTKYVKDGKKETIHRWGANIEPNSRELLKRVSEKTDYRALRLVRSEFGRGLQEEGKELGHNNPATTGWFDWVRLNTIDHGCECPTLAANGPYRYEDVPGYPHPHCHPSGTMVRTIDGDMPIELVTPGTLVLSHDGTFNAVTHAWRNEYSGEMIQFETSHGSVRATPEHPFLTGSGWMLAQNINDDHNLTRELIPSEGLSLVNLESFNSPPKALKKGGFFRVLSLLSPGGVPSAAIDFNGKLYIWESEVDAVRPNGEARARIKPDLFHGLIEHPFIGRPDVSGVELSYLGSVFKCLGLTPNGIMCGASISLPAEGIGPVSSLLEVGQRKPEFFQSPLNGDSADTERLCYLVDREILVAEEHGEFSIVKDMFSTHSTGIVAVLCEQFNGVVYNLTVSDKSSFFANGFASHNCFCMVREQLKNLTDFKRDLRAWANGEPNAELDGWLTETYRSA